MYKTHCLRASYHSEPKRQLYDDLELEFQLNRRYKKGGYSYHEGGPSDERMSEAAAKRGIELTSLSRPLRPDDLVRFDYILAMDFDNKAAIELATDHWAGEGYPIPNGYRDKVSHGQGWTKHGKRLSSQQSCSYVNQ